MVTKRLEVMGISDKVYTTLRAKSTWKCYVELTFICSNHFVYYFAHCRHSQLWPPCDVIISTLDMLSFVYPTDGYNVFCVLEMTGVVV